MTRALATTLAVLLAFTMSSCATARQVIVPYSVLPHCQEASLDQLWENPWSYDGRQICVEGYLGRMVSHGETLAQLFETEADAESRHSSRYIIIAVPMTPTNQEELATHSTSRIVVAGVFDFDELCWPDRDTGEPSRFRCAPLRPMELVRPVIALK